MLESESFKDFGLEVTIITVINRFMACAKLKIDITLAARKEQLV